MLIPAARTRSVLILALLSFVLVAGCGGGGSDGADKSQKTAPKGFTTAKQIGSKLGCSAYLDFKQTGASDSVLCQYAGDNVILSSFKTPALAKTFRKLPPTVSGPTTVLYGSNFAVGCFIKSACESAQKVLGGELV